jgi:flagellar biosynthetic protein FliP
MRSSSAFTSRFRWGWLLFVALGFLAVTNLAVAQQTPAPPVNLNVNLGNGGQPADMATAIQILLFMTVLTLAPAIVMLMTSFTRIVIVLGFVRTALGVQSAEDHFGIKITELVEGKKG